MRTFLQTIFLLMLSPLAFGQLWSDPITDGDPNSANPFNSATGTTVISGLTVSGIGYGTGLAAEGNTDDVYRVDGWPTGGNLGATDYFEFTLTAPTGRHMNFTSFNFTSAGSSSSTGDGGPTSFAVRSSVDGYAADIATYTRTSTSTAPINTSVDLSGASFQNVTGAITFRIYGWSAEAAGGYYEIIDFVFNGTLPALATSMWQENITGSVNSTSSWVTNQAGPVNTADRFVAANLTVSGPSRGTGVAALTTTNAYRATGWTINTTISTTDYFEFTLTPAAGREIDLLDFQFTSAGSSSTGGDGGPEDFSVRSSLDNYAANITTFSRGGTSAAPFVTTVNLSGALFQNLTSPITFRLYGWDAESGNGFYEIRDFNFNGTIALPAVFGSVEAVKTADGLNIKWSTEEETNNDYFEVQASKDGVDFKTVKVVQSTDGDSDVKQDYEVTITEADVAALLAIPAVLGLLSFGFSRRTRLIGFVATLMLLAVNFVACNKNSDGIDAGGADKVFIRIKQVDVNGDAKYSKVIQVVNN